MSNEEYRSCEKLEGYVGIKDIQTCEKLAKDAGYIFDGNMTQSSFDTGCFIDTANTRPYKLHKNLLNTVFFNIHNIDGNDWKWIDMKKTTDIYQICVKG